MIITVVELLIVVLIAVASVLIAPELAHTLHPRLLRMWRRFAAARTRVVTAWVLFRDRKKIAAAAAALSAAKKAFEEQEAAKEKHQYLHFHSATNISLADMSKKLLELQQLLAASHQHLGECVAAEHDNVVKIHATQKKVNSALAEAVEQLRTSLDASTLRKSAADSEVMQLAARHAAKKAAEAHLDKFAPEMLRKHMHDIVNKVADRKVMEMLPMLQEALRADLVSKYDIVARAVPVPVRMNVPGEEGYDAYLVPHGQNYTPEELQEKAVE